MDKAELVKHFIEKLEAELAMAIDAARSTYDAATNEESKAENQYDTRALEASYLAGAQAKRVLEIEETLYVFKNTNIQKFKKTDVIANSALVEIKHDDHKPIFVLMLAKGGGQTLQFQNHNVQVITPNSPLGEALVGMQVDDSVIVDIGHDTKEYEILSVQ